MPDRKLNKPVLKCIFFKNVHTKVFLIAMVFVLISTSCFAQKNKTSSRDVERIGVGLNISFSKKWRFSLLSQLSFQEKFSRDNFFMETRLRFKPLKSLSFQCIFRYDPSFDEFDQSKIILEVEHNHFTKRRAWAFNNRIRLEYIPENKNAPDDFEPLNLLRYRARARYFFTKRVFTSFSFEPVINWADLSHLFFYELVFDVQFRIKKLAIKPYAQYRKYIDNKSYDFAYRVGSNFMLPIKLTGKKANKNKNSKYQLFLKLNAYYYSTTRL